MLHPSGAIVTASSRDRHMRQRNSHSHASAVLHGHLPPQVNGVSVVTAISVAGLRERGWDVHLIAPKYPDCVAHDADPNMMAIPSVALPLYPDVRLVAPDYIAVRETIDRLRPDLVHCTTEFLVGRLGSGRRARGGVPVVTSYHTDFSRYMASYGVPWLAKPVSRYLARFHRRARRTFTLARVVRRPRAARRQRRGRLGVRRRCGALSPVASL